MSKQPSFQFYPGDWLKDPELRKLTFSEKGVYIDLLCVMFGCEKPGILKTGKIPWSLEETAKSVGARPEVLRKLLRSNVLKRSRRLRTIYSARMVRDLRLSRQNRRLRSRAGLASGNKRRTNAQQKGNSSSSSSTSVYSSNPSGWNQTIEDFLNGN